MKRIWLALAVVVLGLAGCGQTQQSTNHSSQQSQSSEQQATTSSTATSADVTDAVKQFTGRNFNVLPRLKQIPVTFVRHVDGDTSVFRLNGHQLKARYLLIDTPETVKPNTPVMPYGMQASNYTHNALNNAKQVTIMFDRGDYADKYDRILVYVFVDGQLLQKQLVEKGLARVAYVFAPSTTYLQELNRAQAQAKAKRLNIWSKDGYVTNRGFNTSLYR